MLGGPQPGDPPPDQNRRPSLRLGDYRFSAVSTVRTLLPRYSSITGKEWDSGSFASQEESSVDLSPVDVDTSRPFPPRYSAIHPQHTVTPTSPDAVQSYDFEYLYPIKTTSTKPWATLHLYVRDSVPGNPRPLQVQPKMPRMWGCERISGRLDLDLDSPLTIQKINIVIKGKITTSALDEGSSVFLDHEFNLWDMSDGRSRSRNRKEAKKRIDGKLMGTHSFPFSIPFPNEFDPLSAPSRSHSLRVSPVIGSSSPTTPDSPGEHHGSFFTFPPSLARLGRRGSSVQRLKKHASPPPVRPISQPRPLTVASSMPQDFMERGVTATVNYQLSVQFIHGIVKRSKITTNICYIPALQPCPSSQKRRQAYGAGALIPGPMIDPDGWFDLPKFSVDGVFHSVYGLRQSKIECQLYVAQPLSYTRGTVIPCFLTLSSNDSEALDSLSNPNIPNVKLIRRLRHFTISKDNQDKPAIWKCDFHSPVVPKVAHSDKRLHHKAVYHHAATATWWVPPKDVLQEVHVRHVEGEIHLRHDLQPSCSCEDFQVEYCVQMFSLQSANFEPTQSVHSNMSEKKPLIPTVLAMLPVDITTLCRLDEALPIPFTKPSESAMRQVLMDEDDEVLARQLVSSGFL